MDFSKRLDEALATVSGTGAPPAINGGRDDGPQEPLHPTPEQVKAIYAWCSNNPKVLSGPAIETLSAIEPDVHMLGVKVAKLAGNGSPAVTGTATIKSIWHASGEQMAGYSQAIRMVLLKSDLWKAIGVRYEDASRMLDSHVFSETIINATQSVLNGMNHSLFWLYELGQEQLEMVEANVTHYLASSGLVVGAKRGQFSVSRVSIGKPTKPINLMPKGYSAPQTMGAMNQDGRVDLKNSEELRMSSAMDYPFAAYVGGDSEAVAPMYYAMESAWSEFEGFSVELYRDEDGVSPEWEPHKLVLPVPYEYLKENLGDEVSVHQLVRQLVSMPQAHLGLLNCEFDCSDFITNSHSSGWVVLLRPLSISAGPESFDVQLTTEVYRR